MKPELYEKLTAYIIENQNRFYRLAFSYVKNQDDALDAVQNAVCNALAHYTELRNEEAIRTWFYRIVINESLSVLRAKKRVVPMDQSSYREIPCEISYEEKGLEIYDDLYAQIGQMEQVTQNIIKLRYFEELELGEIAQVLRMNLSTVKTKLYRGLKALKIVMEKEEGAWNAW